MPARPTRRALALLVLSACSSSEDQLPARTFADAGAVDDAASHDSGPPPALANPDPRDLDATNGDPSLDIAGSEIFFDAGAPWVRVAFYGDWPPNAALQSWACAVILGTQNTPVASYTVTGNRGAQSSLTDGIDAKKITFAAEPKGFRVRFDDPALAFDRYGIECSVQRTPDTTWVQDSSGNFAVTEKVQRSFAN